MELEKYEHELLDWAARYEKWKKPVDAYWQAAYLKKLEDGSTWEALHRDVAAFKEQHRIVWDPDLELRPIVDRMCEDYLIATDLDRARCRALVAMLPDVQNMGGILLEFEAQLEATTDSVWLRKALAVYSIRNGGIDIRDEMVGLAGLFVKAEEMGIDPVPHFQDIARLSSQELTAGGQVSFSKLLSDFPTYEVLQERRSQGKAFPS